MELMEGLLTRRTIHLFRADPVPDSVIEKMLEAAVQAPNHHMTQPWRFVVLQGESLRALAQARYRAAWQKAVDQQREFAERLASRARQDYLAVSAVIAVVQLLEGNASRQEEDYAAVSCAAYAMMLAAWNFGVGTHWATGGLTRSAEARELCQVTGQERLAAFIRLGYPQSVPQVPRVPAAQRTLWLG